MVIGFHRLNHLVMSVKGVCWGNIIKSSFLMTTQGKFLNLLSSFIVIFVGL
jgi:hypothetical protein